MQGTAPSPRHTSRSPAVPTWTPGKKPDDTRYCRRVWFVYVLVSPAGRTYVGVTTDIARRLRQHNGLVAGGARATRAHRPWQVGRLEGPVRTRGRAQSLEYAIKRFRGRARLTTPVGRKKPMLA